MSFVLRVWQIIKYLSLGAFLWVVASWFYAPAADFKARSEPAELKVMRMQTKDDIGRWPSYRPTFARVVAGQVRGDEEYTGDVWNKIKFHEPGDIVAGRYAPETGEMRSNVLLNTTLWTGFAVRILGILIALQVLLIGVGIPEDRLPLRVRVGGRRRTLFRI